MIWRLFLLEADRKASRQKTDKMKAERRKEKTIEDGAGHQSKEKDEIRENGFGSWYTACEYGWYYLRR